MNSIAFALKPGSLFQSKGHFIYKCADGKVLDFPPQKILFVVEITQSIFGAKAKILTDKEIIQLPNWTTGEWDAWFALPNFVLS